HLGTRRYTTKSKQQNREQRMNTNAIQIQMIRRASRSWAMLAVITASIIFTTVALAQMPPSPWKKGAPFPEPDEEFYGVTVNGKLYAIGGWGAGKARGANYEYDPASDKWTKKTSMPKPAHHAALAAANGKIYVFGGFIAPEKSPLPIGAAWQPITMCGSTIRWPTRGRPSRRSPASADPPWPWKPLARST